VDNTLGRLLARRKEVPMPQRTEPIQSHATVQAQAARHQQGLVTLPSELQPKQLLAQLPSSVAEPAPAQAKGQQVPTALMQLLQRFKRMNESLAQEKKGREEAERHATQLEAELVGHKQAYTKLQGTVEQAQRAGFDSLRTTLDEFQVIHCALVERVRKLSQQPEVATKSITTEQGVVEAKAAQVLG
jgi:hypothetical protein